MNKTKTANDSDFDKLMDSYANKDINKFSKLIDQGVNINCLNNNNESFVSRMLRQEYNSVMDEFLSILLKNNISLKQIGIEQSLLAIVIHYHNNTSCLEKLLKNKININDFGVYRFSMSKTQLRYQPAIFHAISKEDDGIIDLLLKYNPDLNIENNDGETPLHFLLQKRYNFTNQNIALLFDKLLKNGADPNILGPYGNTLIHYLASCEHGYDMFEFLFNNKHNININAKNKDGDTALSLAIKTKNIFAVKFLIKKGADINIRYWDKFTVVMLAVNIDDIEILNYILKQSPDLSIVNDDGDNILHLLAKKINKQNNKIHKKYFDQISKLHPELLARKINKQDSKTHQKYFDQISKLHPELLNIKNFRGKLPCDLL